MRGSLETIVGAMFAGKTSELLKRILWAEHQGKKILVIKPIIDNRYSKGLISTHNNLSHECFPMNNWQEVKHKFNLTKENYEVIFLDDGKKKQVGTPFLKSVSFQGKVDSHSKESKIIIFKKKRRKGYQKKNGHKQPFTTIAINTLKLKKTSTAKKTVTKKIKTTTKKAVKKK